ncbi:hypothetical protein BGZ57DRAFT_848729 [Hyaloscypha finlandica]|nr:hypothetical protein BGZ57DRAFT_848729 [Hyaloscypha finlandica]
MRLVEEYVEIQEERGGASRWFSLGRASAHDKQEEKTRTLAMCVDFWKPFQASSRRIVSPVEQSRNIIIEVAYSFDVVGEAEDTVVRSRGQIIPPATRGVEAELKPEVMKKSHRVSSRCALVLAVPENQGEGSEKNRGATRKKPYNVTAARWWVAAWHSASASASRKLGLEQLPKCVWEQRHLRHAFDSPNRELLLELHKRGAAIVSSNGGLIPEDMPSSVSSPGNRECSRGRTREPGLCLPSGFILLERKQGVKLLGSNRVALWQLVPPQKFVIRLAAGSGNGSRAPCWAFPNNGTQVPAAFVSVLQYTLELPTARSLDQSKQTISSCGRAQARRAQDTWDDEMREAEQEREDKSRRFNLARYN